MAFPTRTIALLPDELTAAREYLRARSERRPNGCLEWTLSLHRASTRGRPIAWLNGRRFIASRLAWYVERGDIPAGMLLCHRCDNPRCIDVEHLFLGTAADNNHDRDEKGRHRSLCGESHPLASVPDVHVRDAVASVRSGESISSASRRLGVSRTSVRRWRDGATRIGATR